MQCYGAWIVFLERRTQIDTILLQDKSSDRATTSYHNCIIQIKRALVFGFILLAEMHGARSCQLLVLPVPPSRVLLSYIHREIILDTADGTANRNDINPKCRVSIIRRDDPRWLHRYRAMYITAHLAIFQSLVTCEYHSSSSLHACISERKDNGKRPGTYTDDVISPGSDG